MTGHAVLNGVEVAGACVVVSSVEGSSKQHSFLDCHAKRASQVNRNFTGVHVYVIFGSLFPHLGAVRHTLKKSNSSKR